MMKKRKERNLKELYFITDRLSEPEITPILRGSCQMQGPGDELDHDKRISMEPSPAKKKTRKSSTDDSLQIREEPGKCNMCAAPCTSCVHFGQTVSFMESKIGDELSGEICNGKKANYCSSSDAEVLPLLKSRACEQQHTGSETSNLFCASSSHDSFPENAESKASVRTPDAAEVFDNIELLPQLSSESSRTIHNGKLHAKQCKVAVQGVFVSSDKSIPLDMGEKTSKQYEEQQRLECHDYIISCVTSVKDANEPVSDRNVDSDRKNTSALARNSPAEGFEKAVQDQTEPDFITGCQCEGEENQNDISRPTTCRKHSFQDSSGFTSGTVGFSHTSDPSETPSSNDFNVINSTPKFQPPCARSQSGNSLFGCGYSKDSGETVNCQPQEEPVADRNVGHVESLVVGPMGASSADVHKFSALDSASVLPDNEHNKSSLVGNNSSSEVPVKIHPCQENDIAVESDKPPETSAKSSDLNQQFEKSSSSPEPTGRQEEHPLQSQPISKIEHSASDTLEDDVKVCDICGDTGREEMLATCSRCNDGAEHIYCMPIMLHKVPESDWLCEECQLKKDSEKRKLVKTEVVSETPKSSSLGEKGPFPKSKNKAQKAVGNQAIKAMATPKVPTERHVENMKVASILNKDAVETTVGSPGTASSKRAALSQENSFKNLNVGKLKPLHPVASPTSCFANGSQETIHLLASSTPYASWKQERLHSSLSRSFTVNNSKPKAKEIHDVSQKQKLAREFSSGVTRKEGLIQTFSKNLSFKSTTSGLSNTDDSDAKLQSDISSCSDNSRVMKQGKKQNIIERKKSYLSNRPASPMAGTTTSLTKGAKHDERLCTSSKSTIFTARKGSENMVASDGSGDVKKQSSVLSCPSVIPSFSGMCNSEEQKQCQVGTEKDITASSSRAFGESHGRAEILQRDGLRQIWESMNHDGKTTDPSSLRCYEQNAIGKTVQCHPCKEVGHVSQFCRGSSTLKASTERSFRVVTNKRNKWENMEAAAMSSDEAKLKPHLMSMPLNASIPGNPSRISAIPEHDYIWQGCFEVHRSGRLPGFYDGIQAHLSTCASPKVLGVVNKFSQKVQLEEVSRLSAWPVQFHGNFVTEDNIALYIFAKDLESYKRYYKQLLENMLKNDLALKGNFDGIEFLIFPSNCLPEKSQRWNRLLFFWAVFIGKSINCSGNPCATQKKPFGATVDVEPLVQQMPTLVKAEVTISQKISMQGIMQSELSICDSLPKEPDADKTSNMDLSSLSFSAREDVNCYTKASSLDQISRNFRECSKASDVLLLSENSSFPPPEIFTAESVEQMTGLPATCSLSRTMNSNVLLFSDKKNSGMSQKEIYRDSRNKKSIELQPDIQATNAQIDLYKDKSVPMNTDTLNWRQSDLTSISPDEQDASPDSSKIFPVSSSHQFVNSNGTASKASVRISMKTNQAVAWSENKNSITIYGENENKKIKLSNDSSSQEQIPRERFLSKMCGYQDKEQTDACNYEDGFKTAESSLFPVDLGPVRNLKSGSTIPWKIPADNAKLLQSDYPNLDLALGTEKKPLEQEVLPSFIQVEDNRSSQNEHIDPSTSDAGNDASASLSLSLAFPLSEKEQTEEHVSRTMPRLAKRHPVNTSLLLFGGLTDT
ncbi:hypothetical protein MRB53_003000 [Persea americana]|uniref:Uncharacterized protein n=1 Tax=Persea americana TaxID=3435 RepID=A0ACC2MVY8_PERAE|nr:hypothetical protein MRB53_003000 [Persea americana]